MAHGSISPDVIWIADHPATRSPVNAFLLQLPYPEESDMASSVRPEGWKTTQTFTAESISVVESVASDLFNIGLILGTMAIGTYFYSISNLTRPDESISLELRDRLSLLNTDFADFIHSLTAPDVTARFTDARVALQSLQAIDVSQKIEIRVSPTEVNINCRPDSGQVDTFIRIFSPTKGKLLTGRVRLKSHPSEYLLGKHTKPWISIAGDQFYGNDVICKLLIDTTYLRPNSTYRRELEVWSNAEKASLLIPLTITTKALSQNLKTPPLLIIGLLWALAWSMPFLPAWAREITHESQEAIEDIFNFMK
jgi:hypothetical protein